MKSYRDGRVHGYQSELTWRAWTGGIYDEGRRGQVISSYMNKTGSNAFRNGYWNKVRIEAIEIL